MKKGFVKLFYQKACDIRNNLDVFLIGYFIGSSLLALILGGLTGVLLYILPFVISLPVLNFIIKKQKQNNNKNKDSVCVKEV